MAFNFIFLGLLLFMTTTGSKSENNDRPKHIREEQRPGPPEEDSDGYLGLAAMSGGSVISSNKTDVDHASSITVAEASLAFPVIVTIGHVDTLTTRDVIFSVDVTLTVILVEVTGQIDKTAIKLIDPTGKITPTDGSTLAVDSGGALVYKINSPLSGTWSVRFFDFRRYDVIVKGSSEVSFQHSFLQRKPGTPFQFEISGDPPAGKNLTVKIEVNAIDKTTNITSVTLYSLNGDVIKSGPLSQVSIREANTYKATLSLPAHALRIGITGLDKNGTPITRVSRTAVSPESHFTVKFNRTVQDFSVAETFEVPFTVYNKGKWFNFGATATSDTRDLKVTIFGNLFVVATNLTYTGHVRVTSLAPTQAVAGNIILTVDGPNGESQFDSILVSVLPTTQSPQNGGFGRAPAGLSMIICSLFVVTLV